MFHLLKVYLLLIPPFLIIDYLWLGRIMGNFYQRELGVLARRTGDTLAPVLWAAGIVYLLIPLGIILFALPRVSPECPWLSALGWGFLYGATLYGIYDMTNYSLLEKWSLRMSVVDICWGGTICALATCLAVWLDRVLA